MTQSIERISTGVDGLDYILLGGLVQGGAYLVRGGPGTGKTTLGLHYLTAGAAAGEQVLFVSLGESVEDIKRNARNLDVALDKMAFLDLSPTAEFFAEVESYDIFSPAEVERAPTTTRIIDAVHNYKPQRVFIDSMAQFRYLCVDVFQYRKQVLSFLRYLKGKGITVMFTSEAGADTPDSDVQFLSDGIVNLSLDGHERHIGVVKFRGSSFVPGDHGMRMVQSGMEVLPRLEPLERTGEPEMEAIPWGIPAIDRLLHGGLERGTITIISGPSGVGKTILGLEFMRAGADRGERSILYTFEEEVDIVLKRSELIGIRAGELIDKGTLFLTKIRPLQFTPDEFAHLVRRDVEERSARLVMIDSVSGYNLSLHGTGLVRRLHALCKYLQSIGVTVLLVTETQSIVGDFRATDVELSYLADNIVFLRYMEIQGELRKAIGVLKKRLSDFEKTLREFEITPNGIMVGEPMKDLRGIFSEIPTWVAAEKDGPAI